MGVHRQNDRQERSGVPGAWHYVGGACHAWGGRGGHCFFVFSISFFHFNFGFRFPSAVRAAPPITHSFHLTLSENQHNTRVCVPRRRHTAQVFAPRTRRTRRAPRGSTKTAGARTPIRTTAASTTCSWLTFDPIRISGHLHRLHRRPRRSSATPPPPPRARARTRARARARVGKGSETRGASWIYPAVQGR